MMTEQSWDRACTRSRGHGGWQLREGHGGWRLRERSTQPQQPAAAQPLTQPLVACFMASHVTSEVRTEALSRLLASIDGQEPGSGLPVHLSWHAPEPSSRRKVEALTTGRPWMRRCLQQHSPHSQFEHLEALVKDALNGPLPPPYWVFFSVRAAAAAPKSCALRMAQWPTTHAHRSQLIGRACARVPTTRTTTTCGPRAAAASSRSGARWRHAPT